MGNSEVGHMNLGAGRVAVPELPRIDKAIEDGSLAKNPILAELIGTLKKSGKACHLLGLASPGGVHSHQDHLVFLANLIAGAGVPVWIHAFLDGRDMPPRSALECLQHIEAGLKSGLPIRFATVAGRYYPMDRDKRWDRVALGYDAMVDDKGKRIEEAVLLMKERGPKRVSPFFIPSALVNLASGQVSIKYGLKVDGPFHFEDKSPRFRRVQSASPSSSAGSMTGYSERSYVCWGGYISNSSRSLTFTSRTSRGLWFWWKKHSMHSRRGAGTCRGRLRADADERYGVASFDRNAERRETGGLPIRWQHEWRCRRPLPRKGHRSHTAQRQILASRPHRAAASGSAAFREPMGRGRGVRKAMEATRTTQPG
jgi:hypothetical protein